MTLETEAAPSGDAVTAAETIEKPAASQPVGTESEAKTDPAAEKAPEAPASSQEVKADVEPEKPAEKPKAEKKADDAPKEKPKTIATDTESAEPKSSWGEDWRKRMAGGDEKLEKFLKSVDSPAKLAEIALRDRQKIAELGEAAKKAPPGKGATDEQIAEYRKANGVPEKVADYVKALDLPDGFDKEVDTPLLEGFIERAHARHRDPNEVQDYIDWYFDEQAKAAEVFAEATHIQQKQARNQLIEEWGGPKNFDANVQAIVRFGHKAIGEKAYDELAQLVVSTADGKPVGVLGDHPNFNKLLVSNARAEFGEDLVMIGGDTNEDAFKSRAEKIEAKYLETGGRANNGWTAADEKEFSFIAGEKARRAKRGAQA